MLIILTVGSRGPGARFKAWVERRGPPRTLPVGRGGRVRLAIPWEEESLSAPGARRPREPTRFALTGSARQHLPWALSARPLRKFSAFPRGWSTPSVSPTVARGEAATSGRHRAERRLRVPLAENDRWRLAVALLE